MFIFLLYTIFDFHLLQLQFKNHYNLRIDTNIR